MYRPFQYNLPALVNKGVSVSLYLSALDLISDKNLIAVEVCNVFEFVKLYFIVVNIILKFLVFIATDRYTRRPRGYCFVTFRDIDDAKDAINAANNTVS